MECVNSPKPLLITLDSMRYPNTGLFYFGKHLGIALHKALKKESHLFSPTFYLHKEGPDIFQGQAKLLWHSKLNKYFFKLNRYIFPQWGKYAIIHITDQVGRLNPSKLPGKKVLTIHDLNFLHEHISASQRNNMMHRMRVYINHCDAVVAISKFVANELIQHFPNVQPKLNVIYNGVNKLYLKPQHEPAYRPKKPFILSIGELLPKKNFHVLPALLEKNNLELVIAGNKNDGKYEKKIKQEAKKFNCAQRIITTGPISDEDKAWYYHHCIAFAFPSIAEGFGLPVLEAMYAGKPVFLSNRTALPEIGGMSAFYFSNFEPEHMQDIFEKGMNIYENHPPLKTYLMQHAQSFSWEKAAEDYINIYKNML